MPRMVSPTKLYSQTPELISSKRNFWGEVFFFCLFFFGAGKKRNFCTEFQNEQWHLTQKRKLFRAKPA
jgi:hypothetical protein